jgi:hypothetical protein
MSSDKKLCKWQKQEIKDNLPKVIKIAKKPKHVCVKCGRAAKKEKWLCEPKMMK